VIDNPALGREPLVGYFRTNEPENFARAVASMVGARVSESGQTIHLDR
jgi:transmembrane sensor